MLTLEEVIIQSDLQSDSKKNVNTYMEISVIGNYSEQPFKMAPKFFGEKPKSKGLDGWNV